MDDHVAKTIDVYDAVSEEYAKQAVDNIPHVERKRFISLVSPSGTVLDVGCGSGRDCGYFVDKGFQVTGIDLSDNLLKIARKSVPKAVFSKQDMRSIHLPTTSYDGVWACASLLHLAHDEIYYALSQLFSLLKPRGTLCVIVKAGAGEGYKEEPSIPGLKRFYAFYSKDLLSEHVKAAGFSIIDCYSYNNKDRGGDKDSWWIACFGRKEKIQ